MARPKGQTNMVKKETAYKEVKNHLKYLSFSELEDVIAYALRYKKEKLGNEELRLIKEKEEIEQKLQELKTLDNKMN
ncbi:hypothetical protein M2459_003460 [Parabacteroides sp. PF5-5]|uniref:hypothetical protein n=1 Tax=unclassified Parabacteroides TaxID=2649774 RepID=UPI002474CADC|nr:MULTISPECIES: hypothetical protein [unclassified Parabacteroides]MDH6306913.1 hypothetical protein [Parabacteroides sp. PH5-39]MDH6317699.1 hypothetical protein [Parabacteroides sp. PF5-13]MDH6321714.1 hypothetical protein [Parabacteroides sp. PH5-13]MDH6325300.1 hypothetical protein [Parabacteroides sp. PH5-8]MDH6328884.1 hypothetical protein [Parabacteroides sp. PH5-41]